MKVPDAMPFKAFWFEEEDGSLVHLPYHMARLAMTYGLSPMTLEQENCFFQFLVNSGHIWTWPPDVQQRCSELIQDRRVNLYTEAHSN